MKYEWNYSSTASINRTGDYVLSMSVWLGKSYSDKTSYDENVKVHIFLSSNRALNKCFRILDQCRNIFCKLSYSARFLVMKCSFRLFS